MTDLEMTRLCAEAMGDDAWTDINGRWYCRVRGQETIFTPLTDDAQAMALEDWLIEHSVSVLFGGNTMIVIHKNVVSEQYPVMNRYMRRRAIVECVAKMQEAKNV